MVSGLLVTCEIRVGKRDLCSWLMFSGLLVTCEIRVGKSDLLTCIGMYLSGSPRARLKWLPRACVLHMEASPWTERKEMRIFLLLRGSQVHNFSWKRRFEKMHVRGGCVLTSVGQLSSFDPIISPVVNNLPVDYLFILIKL